MKKDYEIGHGKPPVATQFKKGKSGNPRGRPQVRSSPGFGGIRANNQAPRSHSRRFGGSQLYRDCAKTCVGVRGG